MVNTIKTTDQIKFEKSVNSLIESGYKILSSSCNTYQYSDFPEETYWTAILVRPVEEKRN